MGTLTKETIQKIQKNLRNEFLPFAEQLRSEGVDDRDIVSVLRKYYNQKKHNFFKKTSIGMNFSPILNSIVSDSKIEKRLLFLLDEDGIKLRFQYNIGFYRVDYLIDDFLVLELDGPTHNTEVGRIKDRKRDEFLESFGYKVLHIPVELLMIAHESVLTEIKELVAENRKNRKNRHKRNGMRHD